MSTRFFCSDHHFDHSNIIKFTRADGCTPVRDFSSVDEMNEHMIERHNSVVKANDVVYFLGDVTIPRRGLRHIARLNGKKRLIMGNHDVFTKNQNRDYYEAGFERCSAFHKFDRFVATHIPVHPQQVSTRWAANVHGHLHTNRVTITKVIETPDYRGGYNTRTEEVPDPRYFCVCVEQLDDYRPISMEEIHDKLPAGLINAPNS